MMKKIEKLIFLILVNIIFCVFVSKETKNSLRVNEKLQKEKNIIYTVINDVKAVIVFTPTSNKENEIYLRKLNNCDNEKKGYSCANCNDGTDIFSECNKYPSTKPYIIVNDTTNENECRSACPDEKRPGFVYSSYSSFS